MAVLLGTAATAPLAQAGDARRGADVYAAECSECHSVRAGRHKKGPSLAGVLGRRAAQWPDFNYSAPMRASGWTWDEATLQRYVALPKRALPGGSMKYDGLADDRALVDLLAYLGTLK